MNAGHQLVYWELNKADKNTSYLKPKSSRIYILEQKLLKKTEIVNGKFTAISVYVRIQHESKGFFLLFLKTFLHLTKIF